MPPPLPAQEETPVARADVEFQRALAEAMQNRHVSAAGQSFRRGRSRAGRADAGSVRQPSPRRAASRPEAPAAVIEPERPFERREPEPEWKPAPSAAQEPEADEDTPRRRNPLLTALAVLVSVFGVLVLAGQLVYFNRTRIAAEVPELRPTLEALCVGMGCAVPWPTDIARVRTEWSELAFVPDYPNLIQLSATLKNHATYPRPTRCWK